MSHLDYDFFDSGPGGRGSNSHSPPVGSSSDTNPPPSSASSSPDGEKEVPCQLHRRAGWRASWRTRSSCWKPRILCRMQRKPEAPDYGDPGAGGDRFDPIMCDATHKSMTFHGIFAENFIDCWPLPSIVLAETNYPQIECWRKGGCNAFVRASENKDSRPARSPCEEALI